MIYQVVTTVCFAYWPLMKQSYTDSMWITPFSSRSCHPCGQRHKSRALLRLPLVIEGNRCCLDFWGCAKYRKSVNCALPTSSPARAFNSRNKDHSSGDGSTTTLKPPPNIFSILDGPLWSLWKVNLTVEGLRFLQTVCFPLTLTEMCLFLIRPKIERKKFLKWMICLQQYEVGEIDASIYQARFSLKTLTQLFQVSIHACPSLPSFVIDNWTNFQCLKACFY